MAKGNLISTQIPVPVKAKALKLLSDLDALLTPYYSKQLPGHPDFPIVQQNRIPFIVRGMGYVNTDPVYLLQGTDVPELKRDYALFNDSDGIITPIAQIQGGLLNTNHFAGSDVYVTLLDYYMIVQRKAEQGDARATIIYNDLRKLFNKKTKGLWGATSAPTNPAVPAK